VDAKEPTIRAPGASGASPNMCVARNCPVERHFRPVLIKDGLFCISAAFKRSSCWQFRSNKRLAIGEQLIVDDSLAIPCPSIQAWPPSEPLHRFSTRTVCALRCRKWLTFHSQSPYSSKTGRFCCDWEAICMRLYGQRCFLRLFVWHSYIEVLSDSKLLQMVWKQQIFHKRMERRGLSDWARGACTHTSDEMCEREWPIGPLLLQLCRLPLRSLTISNRLLVFVNS